MMLLRLVSHWDTALRFCAAMVLLGSCPLLASGCGDKNSGAGSANEANIVGIWNGPIAVDQRSGDRIRNVLQFNAPVEAGASGRYGIYGETLGGPALGSRPLLQLAQDGTWHVEDGHIVFDAGAFDLSANEIFDFTGDTLTLESASTKSGRLTYQRSVGCPDPAEREGWSVTTRSVMTAQGGGSSSRGTSIVVDSADRVHIVSGGDGLAYFARTSGCAWAAYGFGPTNAQATLLIAPDDTLHVIGTASAGFFHFTAAAATVSRSAVEWTQVPPGPLNAAIVSAGDPGPIEAAVGPDGVVWAIVELPDPVTSVRRSNLLRYDGTWTVIAMVPPEDGFDPEQVRVNVDASGGVHVTSVRQFNSPSVRVFDLDPAGSPSLVHRPFASPPPCLINDVYVDAAGAFHAACGHAPSGAPGGYLTNAGGDWSLQVFAETLHSIERTAAGFVLVGGTVYRQTATGWRAPGPAVRWLDAEPGRVAVDSQGGVHYADNRVYAHHASFPETARTTIALTFEGIAGGEIHSLDGQLSCSDSCEIEVEAGSVLHLKPLDGSAATFAGWGVSQPGREDPEGNLAVWATGERLELTVRFGEGGIGLPPVSIAELGAPLIGIFDDATTVVAGGYRAGFSPIGVPLTPKAGPSAPYAMGFDAAGGVRWFQSYETGAYGQAVTLLDVASDGTLALGQPSRGTPDVATFGGADHSEPGVLIGVLNPETGAEIWSQVISGDPLELVALSGGRAAVIGDDVALGGASGVVFLDGTGATGELALGPFRASTSVPYERRTSLAAFGADAVIVGTVTDLNSPDPPPALHAVSASGALLWSTEALGGAPVYIAPSDTGGAWVVVEVNPQSKHPASCATQQEALFPRTVLHFRAGGECTSLISLTFQPVGSVMRADGLWAVVGLDPASAPAVLVNTIDGGSTDYVSFGPGFDVRSGRVSWSPGGKRLGVVLNLEGTVGAMDAISWVGFQ